MSVLVTGCGGFIGFHLSKKLLENDIDVIGFDNINNYYDNDNKFEKSGNGDDSMIIKNDYYHNETIDAIICILIDELPDSILETIQYEIESCIENNDFESLKELLRKKKIEYKRSNVKMYNGMLFSMYSQSFVNEIEEIIRSLSVKNTRVTDLKDFLDKIHLIS